MRRLIALFVAVIVVFAVTGHLSILRGVLASIESSFLKKPAAVLLFAALVGWLLGYLVGRYRSVSRSHAFQNRGEVALSRALARQFRTPDYHLLNHVTLPLKEGSTQIDHILVSRFGVFVIETKDHKGWIFANRDERKWTQVIFKFKSRFQNPIHQNNVHVRAVRELLDFLPPDVIRSMVVFTGDAVFKSDVPDGVFRLNGAVDFIAEHATEVISLNRVQFCVGRLETARLAISKQTDVEHVERLHRKYGDHGDPKGPRVF